MLKKIKDKILDSSHDDLLRRIQTSALSVMIACVLTFFLVRRFLHPLLWLHISIFLIALVVALVIGILWFLKQFLPYRDSALQKFYDENPEYKPEERKEESSEKKDNRSKD